MAIHKLYSDDLESFAKFVGVDEELMYEVYYNIDNDCYEEELEKEAEERQQLWNW